VRREFFGNICAVTEKFWFTPAKSACKQTPPFGAVAQLIERVVRNDEVVGLIPICSTIFIAPSVLTAGGRGVFRGEIGVPGVTRTRDQRFRKPLLYPAELRGH
jgi:hypothetical protein